MFDTALVMVDEAARPIVIIPENLPEGKAFLNIVDGGVDIGVGEKIYGRIRGIGETALAMLGMHAQIGMATCTGEIAGRMPEEIEYVAAVTDTRF